MRVLVTGGTGLVGRAIVERLSQSEDIVLDVVTRHPPVHSHPGVNWYQYDLSDGLSLPNDLFASVDCVIHGAAHLRHQEADDYVKASRLNFAVTTEIYQKSVEHGVKKVIYLSGLNFLRKPLEEVIDEEHPVGPATPYAIGKLWGELALFSMLRNTPTSAVALRITSPIPNSVDELHETVIKRWVAEARMGHPIVIYGRGDRMQDYVSTLDIAAAVENAIRHHVKGVFNIASGNPVSNLDVAMTIATRYGVSVEFHGVDHEEHDVWNVSLARSRRTLGYFPSMSSMDCIRKLIA